MKNFITSLKDKNISKISAENETYSEPKSTNINILLNRVKLDKKREQKKDYFFYGCFFGYIAIWCNDILVLIKKISHK